MFARLAPIVPARRVSREERVGMDAYEHKHKQATTENVRTDLFPELISRIEKKEMAYN